MSIINNTNRFNLNLAYTVYSPVYDNWKHQTKHIINIGSCASDMDLNNSMRLNEYPKNKMENKITITNPGVLLPNVPQDSAGADTWNAHVYTWVPTTAAIIKNRVVSISKSRYFCSLLSIFFFRQYQR